MGNTYPPMTLGNMRANGVRTLAVWRSFRVARLKIDQSFIKDVTTSADDAAIVRATIGLAHELDIEVVAEGVETAGQRDFLTAVGCKVAQGYYFGKPVPAAAASELLRRNLNGRSVMSAPSLLSA